jgi:hypothetical protein
LRKAATSKAQERGAERKVFKGWFNYGHELHVMYASAYSQRQAWMHFCRRLARKHDVHISLVMGKFDGSQDNYTIKEEMPSSIGK